MGNIIGDLKSTKFCILDLRFNNGGFDQAGLDVLGYLTTKRILAYTKKARYGKEYTRKQVICVDPKPIKYIKPVYILTSYQTASASETFILGTMNLPNVQRIGSNTAGVFSDVLDKRLPNGWNYGLSNEIYESADCINFEVSGINPDYKIDYNKDGYSFYMQLIDEIKNGDIAIKKAIELGKNQYVNFFNE
jgi:carboxyl-terminal processing protease